MRARVLESRRGLRRRSRAGGCAGEKGLTRGPGPSVGERARERATRWGELRRPRALAGGPERVRGEQAVRDAGLSREGALGRHREKEKRRMGRPGKRRKMGPPERWVRAGLPEVGPGRGFGFLVLGLGWVSFLLLLLFLFLFKLTQSNLFEFKIEFEFNSNTQTNKTMLQHECNTKVLTLDKILIT